jgi:hypothetical protein
MCLSLLAVEVVVVAITRQRLDGVAAVAVELLIISRTQQALEHLSL